MQMNSSDRRVKGKCFLLKQSLGKEDKEYFPEIYVVCLFFSSISKLIISCFIIASNLNRIAGVEAVWPVTVIGGECSQQLDLVWPPSRVFAVV